MQIRVSSGEALDRHSILRLKLQHAKSPDLQARLRGELAELKESAALAQAEKEHYEELCRCNAALWGLEDLIRDQLGAASSAEAIADTAAKIVQANESRARAKRAINSSTNSMLREVKMHRGTEES